MQNIDKNLEPQNKVWAMGCLSEDLKKPWYFNAKHTVYAVLCGMLSSYLSQTRLRHTLHGCQQFVWDTELCYLNLAALIARFMGVNMGPIWGRQDPGGPHVGPMNLVMHTVHVKRYADSSWFVVSCRGLVAVDFNNLMEKQNKPYVYLIGHTVKQDR